MKATEPSGLVADLVRVATQELRHRFTGACPDYTQPAARDPLCAACRAIKRVEEATDVVALADFLNGDAARDVTGSWGFTTTTGDEFRADLLGVLDV